LWEITTQASYLPEPRGYARPQDQFVNQLSVSLLRKSFFLIQRYSRHTAKYFCTGSERLMPVNNLKTVLIYRAIPGFLLPEQLSKVFGSVPAKFTNSDKKTTSL